MFFFAVNVAGTSQFFEPDGADVFGANNPLGEFLNIGTFETPFVDKDIRISRTRGPVFEQFRVFVRKGSDILDSDIIGSLEAELRVEEEVEVGASNAKAEAQVKKVTDAAQSIGEAVTSIGEDVRSAVKKDLEGVNQALGGAMDDVVGKVQDAIENDLQQIGEVVEGALQGERELVDVVSNVTKTATKFPRDVQKAVEDNVAAVSESVEEASDEIVKDVQDAVEADLKKIGDSMSDVRDVVSGKDDPEEDEEEK